MKSATEWFQRHVPIIVPEVVVPETWDPFVSFEMVEEVAEKNVADALDIPDSLRKKHPQDYSDKEQELIAKSMSKKWKLQKLRQFQDLNTKQIQIAFKAKKTDALQNLQAMGDLYTMAVRLQNEALEAEALDEVVSWATTKTAGGFKWIVRSIEYQKPIKELESGEETTRAKAVSKAKEAIRRRKGSVTEEGEGGAPTNVVGAKVAGTTGEPPGKPKKKKDLVRRGKFAGCEVFEVDADTYQKCIQGRKRYARWSRYFDYNTEGAGKEIRDYAYQYPKKSIIVKDGEHGTMCYLKLCNWCEQ